MGKFIAHWISPHYSLYTIGIVHVGGSMISICLHTEGEYDEIKIKESKKLRVRVSLVVMIAISSRLKQSSDGFDFVFSFDCIEI